MENNTMDVWTIYRAKPDTPNTHDARRFVVGAGEVRITDEIVRGTLAELRERFAEQGLLGFARDESDDADVLESWL